MNYWTGYLRCTLDKDACERFINICKFREIELKKIELNEDVMSFDMKPGDYEKVRDFHQIIHGVPHIVEKHGLVFLKNHIVKNTCFYLFGLLFFLFLWYLSGYVWSIEVTGTSYHTPEEIVEDLEEINVGILLRRSALNCHNIETFLREKYKDVSWVSAEEQGGKLQIKIKEGSVTKQEKVVTPGDETHIVANYDGIVHSIVTKCGTPKVKTGDVVKKGDILISGVVDILDDAKTVVGHKVVNAEGIIYLDSIYPYSDSISIKKVKKEYTGDTLIYNTFLINNKSFTYKNPLKKIDKSIKYDIIDRVCQSENINTFHVTLEFRRRILRYYIWKKTLRTKDECLKILNQHLKSLYGSWQNNKITPLSKDILIKKSGDAYYAKGNVKIRIYVNDRKKITQQERSVEQLNDTVTDSDSSET